MVLDRINDVNKDIKTARITNNVKYNDTCNLLFEFVKNIVINAIIIGNLPLHGMNEFVNIAINLSLLLSIILLPTTAQALHPNPEHIVNACFP